MLRLPRAFLTFDKKVRASAYYPEIKFVVKAWNLTTWTLATATAGGYLGIAGAVGISIGGAGSPSRDEKKIDRLLTMINPYTGFAAGAGTGFLIGKGVISVFRYSPALYLTAHMVPFVLIRYTNSVAQFKEMAKLIT